MKLVRIVRDPNKKGVGAPRGTALGVSMLAKSGNGGGGRVSQQKASRSSVTRLIARDPAKGVSANIGTKRDLGLFTNNPAIPNVTAVPSPRILNARAKAGFEAKGTKHVVNRGPNRSRRNLK
jgi:hypothetical protein